MIKLRNLKLIGLLSLLLNMNTYSLPAAKEAQIRQMLLEFLDPASQPSKGFETWIDELNSLIKDEREFSDFLPVLNNVRNQTNFAKVKLEIMKNRGKAPKFVQEILGTDITALTALLAVRHKVRAGAASRR